MAGDWEIVIGLEVHAQITVKAKLFSGAAAAFGAQPNEQVSLVDAGMPGMLPVLNGEVVRHAVRTGLALGAAINNAERAEQELGGVPDDPAVEALRGAVSYAVGRDR